MYRQPHEKTDTSRDTPPAFADRDPTATEKKIKHPILVVDDEPRIVQLLRRELGREYKVFTATGGAEALKILESEAITWSSRTSGCPK